MLDLTIAIPARNEERNISVCLQAIGTEFASRVVVLDTVAGHGRTGNNELGVHT